MFLFQIKFKTSKKSYFLYFYIFIFLRLYKTSCARRVLALLVIDFNERKKSLCHQQIIWLKSKEAWDDHHLHKGEITKGQVEQRNTMYHVSRFWVGVVPCKGSGAWDIWARNTFLIWLYIILPNIKKMIYIILMR